ncbi:MAG: flagellar protein FlgN [Gammaproteobacteria bacterium]|nr:flagellar protein FlgN [Gammaproteobacteria bacterium]
MNPFLSAQSQQQNTASGTAQTEKKLAEILEQEEQCLEQVIQLLKTENTAIVERDIQVIDHLLDKKLMLLSKLEQLDKQRQHIFEQLSGISYSNNNFSHFMKQHPSQEIQQIWQQVKAKLPECKQQNEINGRMINIRKDNTDQVLQILSGRPQNNPQTYSNLGQTSLQKRNALYTEA